MMNPRLLGIAAFLLAAVTGCSSDPRSRVIADTVSLVKDTTGSLLSFRKSLEDPMTKNNALSDQDLIAAQAKAKQIKKNGEDLARIKQVVTRLGDTTSKEEKEIFAKNYGDQLQAALKDMDKEQRELDRVLVAAEKLASAQESTRDHFKAMKEAYDDSMGSFTMLTKQR